MNKTEKLLKLTKILLIIFLMVFSSTFLYHKLPETNYIQESIDSLEKSQKTVMAFSGTTIATSLAISALPDDFASPLANTVSDLNTYFVFMFAVIFIEKLIVIEGTKIALAYIIPFAGLFFIIFMLNSKEWYGAFAKKLLILGLSLVFAIPFSTHFTETVCKDYLEYVDETIAETEAGAAKINDAMESSDEKSTIFDKLSNAFKTAIQGVSDLLTYFKNVIKKCVNSIAIMLITTFVLPLLILMAFRWLLKEIFSLNFSISVPKVRLPEKKKKKLASKPERFSMED